MTAIETTLLSLGLGALLSSLCGCVVCAPACGPDQEEAGSEKKAEERSSPAEQPHSKRPEHKKRDLVGEYLRCRDGCADEPAEAGPACHDKCVDEVSAAAGDPTLSSCPRSCMQNLGSCLAPCSDERSADEVTACRESCRSEGENCVDACN